MKPEAWQFASATAIAVGVGFSVLLMSVSNGVSSNIHRRLDTPLLKGSNSVNVATIDNILTILTVVVAAAMLAQTAVVTFVVGVTVMRSRREEIAIRRQSGVLRRQLVQEFILAMLLTSILGGLVGEAFGVISATALANFTVLPVQFTLVSVFAAFPVTVALALMATLVPAWAAANASPALLRKE